MIPVGHGAEPDLEFLRQVILEGMQLLLSDDDRARQLYARHDTLRSRPGDDPATFADDCVAVLRLLVHRLEVYSSVPEQERQLPFVGLTYTADSTEDAPFLGDIVQEEPIRVGGKLYLERVKGAFKRQTVRVEVVAAAYEETWVLYRAIMHVLDRDKYRLVSVGISDTIASGTPPVLQTDEAQARHSSGVVTLRIQWLQRTSTLRDHIGQGAVIVLGDGYS